ncbi:MAG: DUF2065 domain-containing protein [Hyphomicrobiaceae bacterium]|nr:DUF2065 domain-containing protein [Hyphomicrobiaceae bacterium]
MQDLAVALGLVLVFEGLIWALNPAFGRQMLAAISELPEGSLRRAGWIAVALGALVVWLVRG